MGRQVLCPFLSLEGQREKKKGALDPRRNNTNDADKPATDGRQDPDEQDSYNVDRKYGWPISSSEIPASDRVSFCLLIPHDL